MKTLLELTKDELLSLKYIILRDSYNFSNNYIMATKYDNLKSKINVKFDYNEFWNNNFKKFENIIYRIILNDLKNIKLEVLTEQEKRELIELIDKLLIIFDANKEESINKYNQIKDYKKYIFRRIKNYSIKELLELMDNPLEVDEFIDKQIEQIETKDKPDIRRLYLLNDYNSIDELLNEEEAKKIYRAILKDSLKFYINSKRGKQEYQKVTEYIKNNLPNLLKDEAICLIDEGTYIEHFKETDDDINKLLRFLQNEILLLKTDHFGTSKYKERVPENTRFFLNPTTEKNTFNYDIRIYINTSNSKETYLFLNEYRKKCREQNIEFNMKGLNKGIDTTRKDNTILYSLISDIPKRVKILNEIEIEHPEWIDMFGSPLSSASKIYDSYYGVTHPGIYSIDLQRSEVYNFEMCKSHLDYSDYYDLIERYAFYSAISKVIVEEKTLFELVENKYKKILLNYSKLNNVEVSTPRGLINRYKTNNMTFENIIAYIKKKDFINVIKKENIDLHSTGFKENYKIRIQTLANIGEGRSVTSKIPITISSFMYKFIEE